VNERELKRALRKAVVVSPRTFGLSIEDVNPLLRFWNAGLDPDDEEAKLACFEACRQNVDAKIRELSETEEPKPASKGKRQGPKPSENGAPDEAENGEDKPTSRQIRYYGHLCYELGRSPDYELFKGKSTQQASIEIRELEEALKKKKREKAK
jgi:hypothetical protein